MEKSIFAEGSRHIMKIKRSELGKMKVRLRLYIALAHDAIKRDYIHGFAFADREVRYILTILK